MEAGVGCAVNVVCEHIGIQHEARSDSLGPARFQVQGHGEGFVVVDESAKALLAGWEGGAADI